MNTAFSLDGKFDWNKVPKSARIDSQVLITGNPQIGERVHIAAGVYLFASSAPIIFHNGSVISVKSTVLTGSDDYLAEYTHPLGPTFPAKYRKVKTGPVVLKSFAGVAAHCFILPDLEIGFGSLLLANSTLTRSIPSGEIWKGTPAKFFRTVNVDDLRRVADELMMEITE